MLMALFSVINPIAILSPEDPTENAVISAYITHNPIRIEGNAGFVGPNASTGISYGSGTVTDPFIIEGWEISSTYKNGIDIKNSDVHFVIRNCFINWGAYPFKGIYLQNCSNGTIEDNSCFKNCYAINLEMSNNISVNDNNCSSCSGLSILLLSSDNNSIYNNNCYGDESNGIHLDQSDHNIIDNNNCSENGGGIWLESSAGNAVRNNTCNSNIGSGILLFSSSNNSIHHNNCSDQGNGIFLSSSTDNTVDGNTCNSNNFNGIACVYASTDNILCNNNCSKNDIGIEFYSTTNDNSRNMVYDNSILNSTRYGIKIGFGSDNMIWNNTFIDNNGAANLYDPSHIQADDHGTSNQWNSANGYGNYWCDWTSPDNNTPYGRVDSPYKIDGNASAKDYYPLTAPRILDSPYVPSSNDLLIPILAIAVIITIAVIFASFIVLKKHKEKKVEPPTLNQ